MISNSSLWFCSMVKDASLSLGLKVKNENILSNQMYFQTTNVTDSTVTMRLNAANGGHLDFIYKLLPNSYVVDFTVQASGLQKLLLSFCQNDEC